MDKLVASADERTRYYELAFGIPCLRVASLPDDLNAEYESQFAYLTRLGLLTETERATTGRPGNAK